MQLTLRAWLTVVLVVVTVGAAGCAGSGETPQKTAVAQETVLVEGETTAGAGASETLQDIPFALNTDQAVPPDFLAAYQREALIVVEFYKEGEDPFYPQGLQVDATVNNHLQNLRSEYTQIEFFTYDIDDPGSTKGNQEINPGEYGTLAAQLGVGFTPYVATLAPQEEGYLIENLFQGYVPRPVLDQALLDLSTHETESNTSDVDITIEDLQLTDGGGGIEYFSVRNRSQRPVSLQGFSLRLLDPETGDVNPDSPGVQINQDIEVQPGETVSLGRVPDVRTADGETVDATFEGGQELDLAPGDQVALLDSGGAVASTFTV